MIQFILVYGALLALSSFIINGWYGVTRGHWEINPDGTKVWVGKVFSRFGYWLQRHTIENKPYENNEWLAILFQLKSFFDTKNILAISENFMVIKSMDEKQTTLFFAFAISKGIKVNVNIMPGENKERNMMIVAYKEVKKYALSEYIRYPLGECLACMSSVYGTILWIIWSRIAHNQGVPIFASMGIFIWVILWVMFCLILSHLNEIIFNINHKLSK